MKTEMSETTKLIALIAAVIIGALTGGGVGVMCVKCSCEKSCPCEVKKCCER